MPDRPRQRLRPHAPLLRPRARDALHAGSAGGLRASPPARVVEARPRARREGREASALVGGMEALLSGTTTVIDHHASPNAIDGSLDVIAEALATLGIRSILCYETSDRDGPERAGRCRGESALRAVGRQHRSSLTRGMIGVHASFTLSDETWRRARRSPRTRRGRPRPRSRGHSRRGRRGHGPRPTAQHGSRAQASPRSANAPRARRSPRRERGRADRGRTSRSRTTPAPT